MIFEVPNACLFIAFAKWSWNLSLQKFSNYTGIEKKLHSIFSDSFKI